MKKFLTKEQADNLIWLGVDISSSDMQSDGHITWSLQALLNLFPCGKNNTKFSLTPISKLSEEGFYSQDWQASYEDLGRNILFLDEAEYQIDAVYGLLCILLKENEL